MSRATAADFDLVAVPLRGSRYAVRPREAGPLGIFCSIGCCNAWRS